MKALSKGWIGLLACAAAAALSPSARAQCRTLVRIATPFGTVDVSLLDQDAPQTVANFIRYVDSGRYDGSFLHRLVSDFVLQGGGFRYSDSAGLTPVPTFKPIPNEFNAAHGNLERTIAMATVFGNPNSATSQFFFNLVDNPELNTQNGGFTVFGDVVSGWPVIQQLAALSTMNYNSTPGAGLALSQVPVTAPGFPIMSAVLCYIQPRVVQRCGCYANCDLSAGAPVLTPNDFQCFLNAYAVGSFYANCDGSTQAPVLTPNDFQCFLNSFAAGCQ